MGARDKSGELGLYREKPVWIKKGVRYDWFGIVSIETGDMIYIEYEHIDDKRFDTYESSALAGIEYVLNNLI